MADRAATRRIVPRIPRNCWVSCCGSTWKPAPRPTRSRPPIRSHRRRAIGPEIWALGLRNPWRFAFDRRTAIFTLPTWARTQYEEVDYQPAASTAGKTTAGGSWKDALLQRSHMQYWWLDPPRRRVRTWDQRLSRVLDYRRDGLPRKSLFSADAGPIFLWGLLFTARSGDYWARFGKRRCCPNPFGFNITIFGEDEAGDVYVADLRRGCDLQDRRSILIEADWDVPIGRDGWAHQRARQGTSLVRRSPGRAGHWPVTPVEHPAAQSTCHQAYGYR